MKPTAFIFFLLLCCAGYAQTELTPVSDALGGLSTILGGARNSLTKVTVIAESEREATVSIDFAGFKDKTYIARVFVLSSLKRAIPEIEPVTVELPVSGNTFEATFFFKPQPGKAYSQQVIESALLGIMILDASSAMATLNSAFSDLNVGGASYTYRYPKKWRVPGSQNMVVQVKMTPVGSAATLKQ